MSTDALKSALEEISPTLEPDVRRLVAALLEDRPVEEAWEDILQEILDEA